MPKIKKLSAKDAKKVMDKYQLSVKELPSILSSDTALIGMDIEEGDIIEIERESPTAGKTKFYRGVVNG